MRRSNARHADMIRLGVPDRLARWLLRHAGELDGELGTTRSTLNRAMRGFESLGLIRVDGARIVLDKPDRLAASPW